MNAAAQDEPSRTDVMPVVPRGSSGKVSLVAFIVLLALCGAWIFSLMNQQREAMQPGALNAATDTGATISSPPPLALPRDFGREDLGPRVIPASATRQEAVRPIPRAAPSQISSAPHPGPVYTQPPAPVEQPRAPVTYAAPDTPRIAAEPAVQPGEVPRVRAARFVNPSRTVPQGTVIPAVLETALDSTRPGGVRALVQQNVHSFDGSRVLIHRGSRLYGEYDAELQRGQKRALVRWTRLIRPDGVTVALDSPASDPLGRAGVKGKVDGKFFQRFGGALLQSVLDIGVGVATREASDGVIVALPGSTQNVTSRTSQADIAPTLTVRHGTSVSVFVAQDLDFSSVE